MTLPRQKRIAAHDIIPPLDLVIFGGTGDLAARKLLPALLIRFQTGELGAQSDSQTEMQFRIVCLGQRPLDRASFHQFLTEKVADHLDPSAASAWPNFLSCIHYACLDATVAKDYAALKAAVRDDDSVIRIFYLSTPPDLFTGIVENLAGGGLVHKNCRLVLEKPLGRDLASARAINTHVQRYFEERQIFRIDHYLGKETVQNLLALRFGNVLFEPLWRREWVSDVQITIAEDIGVGTRAGYYDRTGALRDMLQNHLLQLLCIVAMEPPTSLSPDAVRDEKLKILKALKPFGQSEIANNVVRGAYRAGMVNGAMTDAYADEDGVPAGSTTETYVALKAEINSWRWAGVPFFLRTGKRMPERVAEIVVRFRALPHSIFPGITGGVHPNTLHISLQPDEGLRLRLMAKTPGEGMHLRATELELDFHEAFKTPRMEAYERLLLDVMRDRPTLFTRGDELEAAWEWVEPILAAWEADSDQPRPYTAGTWGPPAATAMLGREGMLWREEA
jgi:glucose-6-phosphate 1-dehydrogenase